LRKGYKLDFKLLMEGIEIPFKSATVTCTPNGNEASINVYSSENIYDIKPKTAIQIFYREWFGSRPEWKLFFDGSFSSFYEIDEASEARALTMICRDFRMDIRKTPAALSFTGEDTLGNSTVYYKMGLFQNYAIDGKVKGDIKEVDSKLFTISYMVHLLAGTANYKVSPQKQGEYSYQAFQGADIGYFLDAVVRGLWLEAVGGTSICTFLNKRLRVEKKFLIPVNQAGTRFWNRNHSNATLGSYLLGNAVFTSVEAAIMRLGALFNTRVYSCNTPSLIPVESGEQSNDFVMSGSVRSFIVDKHPKEFGAKYIINESMLLPPLEFTAPPNCNIVFPSMYDRLEWRQDYDIDYTRGYFKLTDLLSSEGSEGDPFTISYQVPNELFKSKFANQDKLNRSKPPITEEEKYKGVNILFDNIEHALACSDAEKTLEEKMLIKKTRDKLQNEINKLNERLKSKKNLKGMSEADKKKLEEDIVNKNGEKQRLKFGTGEKVNLEECAIKRHAIIKFLNSKYLGRVASVDMMFNPFIICGFPSLIIAGSQPDSGKPIKDIIGMVQQVRHSIIMTTAGGEAATSIVLSNPRFVDDPTDMDGNGNPLFMKETDKKTAEIDINNMLYKKEPYYVQNPKQMVIKNPKAKNSAYDVLSVTGNPEYIYAKDLLSISEDDFSNNKRTSMFLDRVYEVNRIARFYKLVLRHRRNSLMVGEYTEDNKIKYFMFDSIHEAVVNLRKNMKADYDWCLDYIYRDVCSADAFYHGILGVSSLVGGKYISRVKDFDDTVIYDRYYGITNDFWNSDDSCELKEENGGLMKGPGDFSTINENMPVTYFIKERREAVERYRDKVIDSRRFTRNVQ